jgi:hypothetical protein
MEIAPKSEGIRAFEPPKAESHGPCPNLPAQCRRGVCRIGSYPMHIAREVLRRRAHRAEPLPWLWVSVRAEAPSEFNPLPSGGMELPPFGLLVWLQESLLTVTESLDSRPGLRRANLLGAAHDSHPVEV